MKKLKVLTLNIRRDEKDDGINNWEFRTGIVEEILKRHQPDIAVFQEVYHNQLLDLAKMLSHYQYVGVGRENGKQGGEYAPVFYKNLEMADSGNFWLSDTPNIPSNTWPGLKRICTWATFSGENPFVIMNTHLDNGYSDTRLKSAGLIKERIGQFNSKIPVILTGDFNCTPDSDAYRAFSGYMTDTFPLNREIMNGRIPDVYPTTFHDFKGNDFSLSIPGPIDYILYRGEGIRAESRILSDNPAKVPGVYPSDHWPVLCEFTFSNRC